jgi:hypothetical protein
MSGTKNELDCNQILSKKIESENESLSIDSAIHASVLLSSSNDSEPKKAISSKLIKETALNSSMSGTKNELDCNQILSKKIESENESLSFDSAIHASVLLSTSNDLEPKKAISSKLIKETALNSSMSGTKNELDCNQNLSKKIESENESLFIDSAIHASVLLSTSNDSEPKKAISSKLIKETALNSSMSGTKNELDCNQILSKKIESENESLFIDSAIHASSLISTSNDSEPKKAISSKLIKETALNSSMSGTKNELDCNQILGKKIESENESLSIDSAIHASVLLSSSNDSEPKKAISSKLIKETALNSSMSGTKNELDCNQNLSKKIESENESLSIDSAIHASSLISTSNDSDHKKAISSKLIAETAFNSSMSGINVDFSDHIDSDFKLNFRNNFNREKLSVSSSFKQINNSSLIRSFSLNSYNDLEKDLLDATFKINALRKTNQEIAEEADRDFEQYQYEIQNLRKCLEELQNVKNQNRDFKLYLEKITQQVKL